MEITGLISEALGGDQIVLSVKTTDSVVDAASLMSENAVGCLLITDDRAKVVGIVTERDIVSKVIAKGLDAQKTHICEIMTGKIVACTPATSLMRAQQIMAEHNIRHLPVIQDGCPIGMISTRDVLKHQLASVQAVAQHQSALLGELETKYPGISSVEVDHRGRVVI